MELNIEKEWLKKRAEAEGDLEIGAGRRTSTINLAPEEIAELERLQFEALPKWAQDQISSLKAAAHKPYGWIVEWRHKTDTWFHLQRSRVQHSLAEARECEKRWNADREKYHDQRIGYDYEIVIIPLFAAAEP